MPQPQPPPDHPDYSSSAYLPPGHVERLHASEHETTPPAEDQPGAAPPETPEARPVGRG